MSFNADPNDRINNIVKAIAFAEGCINKDESYNIHSLPYRLNNPCDLKATSSMFHHTMDASGKLRFSDISTGWNAGYHQVWLMATNKSHIYNKDMSWQDIANRYAREGDTPKEQTAANNWAKNVALFLADEGADLDKFVTLSLDDYLNVLAPSSTTTPSTPVMGTGTQKIVEAPKPVFSVGSTKATVPPIKANPTQPNAPVQPKVIDTSKTTKKE
jgi:hypothetical protein